MDDKLLEMKAQAHAMIRQTFCTIAGAAASGRGRYEIFSTARRETALLLKDIDKLFDDAIGIEEMIDDE